MNEGWALVVSLFQLLGPADRDYLRPQWLRKWPGNSRPKGEPRIRNLK